MTKEQQLISGLKTGHHDSYEALFKLYYAKFVNFADAILKNRTIAKDIVQESFIRIWLNKSNLNENQSLENYIYVIVKRLILNHIRDSKLSESLDSDKAQIAQSNSWGGKTLLSLLMKSKARFRRLF